MYLAFGVDRLDDVAARLEEVLELTPPQGLVDKVELGTLKSIADSAPKTVSKAPCQESCSPATTSTWTSSRSCAAGPRPGAVHHPPCW